MIQIPLAAIPNQSFSLQLSDVFYTVTIRFVINLMTVTVVRDSVTIIENVRAEANARVIPYEYLEDGNFAFTTVDNEYPLYTRFGVDQFLLYFSQTELEEERAKV